MTKHAKLIPTVWVKLTEQGQSIYVHNPGASPAWAEFDSFDTLMTWVYANPEYFFTQADMDSNYIQLSFKMLRPEDIGKLPRHMNG